MPTPHLQLVENAIVQHLRDALPDVRVLPFPEDLSQLGSPVSGRQLFVGFKQVRFQPGQSLNFDAPIIQQGEIDYELLLCTKDLRTHTTTYPIVEAIDRALTGFMPMGRAGKWLTQRSGGFTALDQGVWGYVSVYSLPYTKKTLRR
ncbi:MAG: Gp37 family protein [Kaiparowitsia implicata GSE-PSE-MK54-09C]|jgi:hypothetical protein|nr:Gp37 family protein [Kaiparowitsia implicata GSE-PSE-MK54-09C]